MIPLLWEYRDCLGAEYDGCNAVDASSRMLRHCSDC